MITLLILILQALGGNYNNYQEESFNQRPLDSYTNCHTPLTGVTAACLAAPLAAPKRNMSPGVLFAAFLHSPCGQLPDIVVKRFFNCSFCLDKHGERPVWYSIFNCRENNKHMCL